MPWFEIVIPAAIAAVTSFVVAILTLQLQYTKDLRELRFRVEDDVNAWKLKFAELSAKDTKGARAAAQQMAVGTRSRWRVLSYTRRSTREYFSTLYRATVTSTSIPASQVSFKPHCSVFAKTHL